MFYRWFVFVCHTGIAKVLINKATRLSCVLSNKITVACLATYLYYLSDAAHQHTVRTKISFKHHSTDTLCPANLCRRTSPALTWFVGSPRYGWRSHFCGQVIVLVVGQKKTRGVEQGNQRLAKEVHPTLFSCWSTTLDGPTSAIMWKMGRYQHPGSHYFLAVISITNAFIVIIVPITRLDKLAAQGVQLKSHYVQPTCTPSRYKFCNSLFTSMALVQSQTSSSPELPWWLDAMQQTQVS